MNFLATVRDAAKEDLNVPITFTFAGKIPISTMFDNLEAKQVCGQPEHIRNFIDSLGKDEEGKGLRREIADLMDRECSVKYLDQEVVKLVRGHTGVEGGLQKDLREYWFPKLWATEIQLRDTNLVDYSPLSLSRSGSDSTDTSEAILTGEDKCDFVSAGPLPSCLEIKPSRIEKEEGEKVLSKDWEVLRQCQDRILAQIGAHAYLKRFIIFGLAWPHCWLFSAKLSIKGDYDQHCWKVDIFSISVNRLMPLWALLCKLAADPDFYLQREAQALRSIPKLLFGSSLALAYFSVRHEQTSSSGTVFLVDGPSLKTPKSSQLVRRKRRYESTCAIKVFLREHFADFQRETTTLDCIMEASSNPNFYVLGHAQKYEILSNHDIS